MTGSDNGRFQRTVLPNGVKVISERIPSVRSISVGVYVPTGSRDESAGLNGISHFAEHMVFKGTRRRQAHHISRRMEAVGGYLNAYTSKEYTCFFARSLDAHLARAVDILGDLVLEPSFPAKELEKEKEVVLEEIRMYGDVPEDAVFDLYERAIYRNHALGRPILGSEDTVRSFSRPVLKDYVTANYLTDGLLFAAAGNVDHDSFAKSVDQAFSVSTSLGKPPVRIPPNGYDPDYLVVEKHIQQAHLVLGGPAIAATDSRRTAMTILNTILGGGMSSRLSQNIRERYGYCYNIYSFVNFLGDTGEFGVYAGTEASRLEKLKQLVFRELDKLAQNTVGTRTLSQAKSQLKGGLMLGLEDLSSRMIRLARMELYFDRYFSLDESLASIDNVTADQVRDVSAELLQPSKFSFAAYVPDNTK